jgi:uncharacterized protein (TIGR00251 family)
MVDDLFDIVGTLEDAARATGEQAPPDVVLRLHVQPGAGRSAVVGRHGDALKVKVSAPPAGGRANAAVMTLVAETFGVPEAQLELTGGASSRSKRVRISGVATEDVRRMLQLAIEQGNAGGGPGVRSTTR